MSREGWDSGNEICLYERNRRTTVILSISKILLEIPLSQNARIVYCLLYDRARISRKNQWMDEQGRVYGVFPIEELSQKLGKCQTSVKKALQELEKAGLLCRKFGGFSRPKHLYVLVPEKDFIEGNWQTGVKVSSKEVESRRSTGRKPDFTKGGNTSSSKVIEQNNKSKNRRVKGQDVSGRNYFIESDYDCGEEESL